MNFNCSPAEQGFEWYWCQVGWPQILQLHPWPPSCSHCKPLYCLHQILQQWGAHTSVVMNFRHLLQYCMLKKKMTCCTANWQSELKKIGRLPCKYLHLQPSLHPVSPRLSVKRSHFSYYTSIADFKNLCCTGKKWYEQLKMHCFGPHMILLFVKVTHSCKNWWT